MQKSQMYKYIFIFCFLEIVFGCVMNLHSQMQSFQHFKDLSVGNIYCFIQFQNFRSDAQSNKQFFHYDQIIRQQSIRGKQYAAIQRVSWWRVPLAPLGYRDSLFYFGTQLFFQRSDSTTVYQLNTADSAETMAYTIDSMRVNRFGIYPYISYQSDSVLGIQSNVLQLHYVYSFQGACPNVFRNYAAPFGVIYENTSCSWGSAESYELVGAVLNSKRYGNVFAIPAKIANAAVSVQQDLPQTSTVFPNPSTGRIYIQTTEKITDIRVLSLHGMELYKQRTLVQENNSRYSLDISLPSGIYFIEVIGEKTRQYHKIVKE